MPRFQHRASHVLDMRSATQPAMLSLLMSVYLKNVFFPFIFVVFLHTLHVCMGAHIACVCERSEDKQLFPSCHVSLRLELQLMPSSPDVSPPGYGFRDRWSSHLSTKGLVSWAFLSVLSGRMHVSTREALGLNCSITIS